MKARLYADEHVPVALVRALQRAGHDVVRAIDVLAQGSSDEIHFARAVAEKRALVSADADFLAISAEHLRTGGHHPGIVYWAPGSYWLGQLIRRLLLHLELMTEESRRDQVKFL